MPRDDSYFEMSHDFEMPHVFEIPHTLGCLEMTHILRCLTFGDALRLEMPHILGCPIFWDASYFEMLEDSQYFGWSIKG